ncbi:MAG TPA: serine/threonine-protein kinase, partial [Planctomycetota bacterium]
DVPDEARAALNRGDARLNHYILVRQVGRGGMGAVWRAWDTALSRWVAIKFLLGSDESDIRRFHREAKLSAGLHHPYIAAVYEVGTAPAAHAGASPSPYLVMQFIDGGSLGERKFPLRETVSILHRVAEAVDVAHRSGVVHRDLKPQNIMVTADGRPYVMDFGLAKVIQADSSLSMTGMVVGTPSYMPPEQALGQPDGVDARSDVYSLGATLYALACGKTPYAGSAPMDIVLRVLREAPERPRAVVPDLPEPLERIILKAMARRPEDRYPTAAALADDLRRFLDDDTVQARAPASGVARPRSRAPLWIGLAVAAAVGALAWAWRPAPSPPARVAYADFDPKRVDAFRLGLRGAPKAWVDEQIRAAARDAAAWAAEPRTKWPERKAAALRLIAWADALEPGLLADPGLAELLPSLVEIRKGAEEVAVHVGDFTLRLYVRGASLAGLRRDGKALPLPAEPDAPLSLTLRAGEYDVDLLHPAEGRGTLKVRGEPGKTLTLVGSVKAPRVAAE